MEKYLIVTHGEDLDGIGAATLMTRHLQQRHLNTEINIKYKFVTYSNLRKNFLKLGEDIPVQNKNLIILDLNIDGPQLQIMKKISYFYKNIIVVDHHSGTVKNEEILTNLGIKVYVSGYKQEMSTSAMVYHYFKPGGRFPRILSHIAQVNDYPKTTACNSVIAYGNNMQKIITLFNSDACNGSSYTLLLKMMEDLMESPQLFKMLDYINWLLIYTDVRKIAEKEFKGTIQNATISTDDELRTFVTAYGSSLLPQKEMLRWIREQYKGKDYSGYYTVFGNPVNNVLFFKDPDSDFDASEFCSFMGGGGRDGDGGFSIEKKMTVKLFFSGVRDEINFSLQKFLDKD